MADRFDTQLIELGITLTEKQKIQFHRYYELLVEWNKVMNLTGITEYDEVNEKHFVDSLAIIKAVKMEEIHSVIDIGTGAGFPGIPLKIAFPHLKVVLLDSLQKRIHFLDTVIEELGLEEVETLHGRAEDYAKRKEYREQFEELNGSKKAIRLLGGELSGVVKFQLPGTEIGRSFVQIKKNESTKKRYPRKAGLPAKEPLGQTQ